MRLPSKKPLLRGLSAGWILAGMAWSSVFQEPLWVGALSGVAFSLVRVWLVRNPTGCLGCAVSSFWAWPIALVGGIVWAARAV